MATKFERAMELLESAEQDAQVAAVRDVIETLKDFLKDGVAEGERAGMKAAIEIIQANFSTR